MAESTTQSGLRQDFTALESDHYLLQEGVYATRFD